MDKTGKERPKALNGRDDVNKKLWKFYRDFSRLRSGTMTNEERDEMIMEMHDIVVGVAPMVKDHHKTLYGNGDDNKGIKTRMVLIEERHTTHIESCPARKAASLDNRNYSIAKVMMIIAILSLFASTILGAIALVK